MSNNDLEHILARVGIPLPQRRKIINGMISAAQSNDDDGTATAHLPRASAVAKTLTAAGFDSDAVDHITRALVRGGHLHDDAGVLHASAANLSPVQKQGLRLAERFGVVVKNGAINKLQMDEALSQRSIEERMRAKTLWAACGYID